MPSSIFAKYSPELILGDTFPLAIADDKFKIFWFNKSFKKYFPDIARLKGMPLSKLLLAMGTEDQIDYIYKKPEVIFLPKIKQNIRITPIFNNVKHKVPTAYKLELLVQEEVIREENISGNLQIPGVDFRSELQEILTLMVKESSIDSLSNEIVIKSVNLANADFGLIVF